MIKYIELKGYVNRGEVGMFSHVYQFIEKDTDTPMVIIIKAYDGNTKVFKGYLFMKNNTFEKVLLTEEEIIILEPCIGKINQKDIKEVLRGTDFEAQFENFKEME